MFIPIVEDKTVKYIVGIGNKSTDYNDIDTNLISILWDNTIIEINRKKVEEDLITSEFDFRNLFESSRDALLLFDPMIRKIVLTNKATNELYGYSKSEEFYELSPLDLSPEYQPDGRTSEEGFSIYPQLAIEKGVQLFNWIHKRKDGTTFPSEVMLSPINYSGKLIILTSVRDITYRSKIENDLMRTEESFELAVKEAGLGVWDYDVENGMMSGTKGLLKMINGKEDKAVIKTDDWVKLIHPEDVDEVRIKMQDHINGKTKEYRNEYRILTKEGEFRWIQIIGRAIERDQAGLAKRMMGVSIDVDERKKLSMEIEDTRNWLQTIMDSIDSILFVKDRNGRFILINHSFTDKLGLKMENIIGKHSDELSFEVDEIVIKSDQLVIEKGVEQTYEQKLTHKDGKTYDYLTTKIPIKDKNGEIYAIVGLATDISRIKMLEKELRDNMVSLDAAITGTGNGLWDWDKKNDILKLNGNWYEMLGYSSSQFKKLYEPFRFQTFVELLHPDDRPIVEEELEKHYKKQTDYYRLEIRLKTFDNKWKWVLTAGKVWEWEEDEPIRMVGIHIDIDSRVGMEERLKMAIRKAEESDRLKSAFLANMSHEIRTPMNGIIGFLDLLEKGNVTEEQRFEYMDIIRNSSRQLLFIVNDIVDISKIEADQIDINDTETDINILFNELVTHYKSALSRRNITISGKVDRPVNNIMVIADQTKLRQILTNLVSNAVKFTTEGFISIKCSKKGDYLEFIVEDTGSGIPESLHGPIFERFRQAENGLSRIKEGTGLGLAICKAYVEKMGGKIWLESEIGKGTRFYFTVPYKSNEKETKTIGKESSESQIIESKGVVLVVEDELYNFLFAEQALRNHGFEILHAETGDKAIEFVKAHPDISIVLMDIRLPDIDGYEITRKIKQLRPALPVVALTALALSGDREKAFEAGCDDYLKKPIHKEQLISVVRRFMN
jgi:PAS domain S-box-containing protein